MKFFSKIFKNKAQPSISTASTEEKEIKAVAKNEKEKQTPFEKAVVGVIRAPRATEKASAAARENKYVFRVVEGINKPQVRRAIEARYGVAVRAVNMVNIPGKERRRGRQIGWKPGFKKAVVTLKEGQSIEVQ